MAITDDKIALHAVELAVARAALAGATTSPPTTSAALTVAVQSASQVKVDAYAAQLAASGGTALSGHMAAGTGAVAITAQKKLRNLRRDITEFGAVGNGVANDTAARTLASAATGGCFHYPSGYTFVLDASPDPFADNFTAGDNVILKVGGTNYDVSNSFAGGLRYVRTSSTKLNLIDAATGNTVMYLQNGGPGTATGFFRGLAFTTDSHCIQAQPATLNGSVDILFQRSTLHADAGGNRFNFTFNESIDRVDFSHATTATGAPVFDSYLQIVGGLTPSLTFPAVQAMFNQGWSVKQRAAGGFQMKLEPFTSAVTKLQQVGGSATEFIRFADNSMGFFGAAGGARPTITGSRGANVALANLLANLAALGLVTDSTVV